MTNYIVEVKDLNFVYNNHTEEKNNSLALSNISLQIEKGQFVAIIGRNGSGKSTLARMLNALYKPTTGAVYIKKMDTRNEANLWEIRRTAGIVFQNPDNQIIGTTVEEDVAFGPENQGIPPEEIIRLVNESLKAVSMHEFSQNAPHFLSGGQKQRVAIAGILAMKPECIIFDEATAMLDPIGRNEVLQLMKKLNEEEKITIIHITHHMNEAVNADRVLVIDEGKILMDGTPATVFSKIEEINRLGLEVPQVTEVFYRLKNEGFNLPLDVFDVESAAKHLALEIKKKREPL